jgi:hypothetical protein
MTLNPFATSRVILFTLLATGPLAHLAHGDTIPAPNPMDIFCNGVKLGTLDITTYGTATDSRGRIGAEIQALFTKSNLKMNYNFEWIQAVTGGQGTIGQDNGTNPPYLDPYDGGPGGKREDNLPWYWTVAENMSAGKDDRNGANGANGPGTQFFDFARQDPKDKGNFITFETAFVSVDGLKIHFLKGFTWGYKINANMTATADPFAWLNAPTASLTGPTDAWDGTLNPKGGGKPVGYNFVNGACPCTTIPEPSWPGLIGFGVIAIVYGVNRSWASTA